MPIAPDDAAVIGQALAAVQRAHEQADKAGAPRPCAVAVASAILAKLSRGAAELARRAHVDDVIATGLRALGKAERAIAVATLSLSPATRQQTRDFARQIQEALHE